MIVSKLVTKELEIERVNKFLKKELGFDANCQDKDIVYIIAENDELMGTCLISVDGDKAILDDIYISKPNRGIRIGDGLFRASLNYVLSTGINKIYCDKNYDFLKREGFYNTQESNTCDIEKFFSVSTCGDD